MKNPFKKLFKRKKSQKRKYAAADTGRLLSTWGTSSSSVNNIIRTDLKSLRARSRQLARDDDYARRYLKLCVSNIIGPGGMKLQSKAKDPSRRLDKKANQIIEDAFHEWSKREYCSLNQMSFPDLQRLIIETVARDGECLVKIIRGKINKFGFALQVIEADHLDVDYNEGNIVLGIENDAYGRPIAYHIYPQHPGDLTYESYAYKRRMRIPTKDMIHVFYTERPNQKRGIPWMASAMTRMKHLNAYEEAEIIAARIGASAMGAFTSPEGTYPQDEDDSNDFQMEFEPGEFFKAPDGYDVKFFTPQHPAGNFDPFIKSCLRGIAAGLNVSYASLSNDLSSVNYSSIRAGSIEERDYWKTLQAWFIDVFLQPVYSEWLASALAFGQVDLPVGKYDKYNNAQFYARSWDWVDPQKDVNSKVTEIDNNLTTLTYILAEQGIDLEDLLKEKQREKELLEEYGLTVKKPEKEEESNEGDQVPELQEEDNG